ncbi:hypothetical protein NVS89_22425 [Ancylobacter sp. MQZ15Z-1]|uniref:Uncharacterized protein n=1 Tax=Ancylobacter mangrovi TaxID=2972472 RepID=A0A9X2PKQ2_9HYPH|nr:hypothetical protein [Ancylobacter mangrovi]MCS0497850.1 hypothetical protein [Ancylobacter mangrovi]
MPYDPAKDPWYAQVTPSVGLGRSGAVVTPSDDDDLARYARLRIFVPADAEDAQISVLPVDQADDAPLILSLPVGQVSILEYLVRRVLATGTTEGLEIHTVA